MTTASNLSENIKSNFLKLSGGTLTGALKKSTLGGELQLAGGTTFENGAAIALYGGDCTTGYGHGQFLIRASSSSGTYKDLVGNPNGTLTWGGKGISVNSMGTNYIRYDSGLQLCWGCNVGILTGNQFYVNFPVAFIGAPTCVATVRLGAHDGGYYVLRLNSVSTTQAHYFMFINSSITTNNPSVDWLAIGQWK